MKLASYYYKGLQTGAVVGDRVWNLRKAAELYLLEVEGEPDAAAVAAEIAPADMKALMRRNHGQMAQLRQAVGRLAGDSGRLAWLEQQEVVTDLKAVKLLPPVLKPSKIACIGDAFISHVEEVPDEQIPPDVKVSFFKTPSALIPTGEPLRYPKDSNKWDYECELAIVIGKTCHHITPEEAPEYIFGYTIMHDASNRDVPPILGGLVSPKGKSADTLAPMGPWIATPDELPEGPNRVQLRCLVNGEVRQDSNTEVLLWTIERMVAKCASFMRLLPGDIITTSTPGGAGLGSGRYLKTGDVVRMGCDPIGYLENPVGEPQ